MKHPDWRSRDGYTLITVVVVLVLLILISTTVCLTGLQNLRAQTAEARRTEALYRAEGAVERFFALAGDVEAPAQEPREVFVPGPSGPPAPPERPGYLGKLTTEAAPRESVGGPSEGARRAAARDLLTLYQTTLEDLTGPDGLCRDVTVEGVEAVSSPDSGRPEAEPELRSPTEMVFRLSAGQAEARITAEIAVALEWTVRCRTQTRPSAITGEPEETIFCYWGELLSAVPGYIGYAIGRAGSGEGGGTP